ncbi:hypothetical protein MANES_10G064100v8 [Manihot esculenta]|nr:hypothetical protein MANES_10G064100v8 [Manihot esculenta]
MRKDEKQITIKGDNDIIDCVDIYKQPAFSHPLLKNHTIQMKPSSYPKGFKEGSNTDLLLEWNKKGRCPEGTIPIIRTQHKVSPKRRQHNSNILGFDVNTSQLEYAQVSTDLGTYFGAFAKFLVWNPKTVAKEFSSAQMWVVAGDGPNLNSLEAGWQVHFGEKFTRLFISWTRDNYKETGCYNLECPDFVQINNNIALGSALLPVSVYDGNQYEIEITIFKDMQNGNWWLVVQGQKLGYWPASILTTLANQANVIRWGGKVYNTETDGEHTFTQMGTGHFSYEGYGKAGLIHNLKYVDNSGALTDPNKVIPFASRPSCYDVQLGETGKDDHGTHFYYGGPGYSEICMK